MCRAGVRDPVFVGLSFAGKRTNVKSIIAEFILRHASDAAELAQRAKVLAALTQLSPQRRNELAEAVNMVCRTIAAHGGKGKVRFSLVNQWWPAFIEVSVCDLPAETLTRCGRDAGSAARSTVRPLGSGGHSAGGGVGRSLRIVGLARVGCRHPHGADVASGLLAFRPRPKLPTGHRSCNRTPRWTRWPMPCAAHGRWKWTWAPPAAKSNCGPDWAASRRKPSTGRCCRW